MIFLDRNATCEFCGSKDLKLETDIIWKWSCNDSCERIKCCNCGKTLLKDYEEKENE
jgi:hypothetical protein